MFFFGRKPSRDFIYLFVYLFIFGYGTWNPRCGMQDLSWRAGFFLIVACGLCIVCTCLLFIVISFLVFFLLIFIHLWYIFQTFSLNLSFFFWLACRFFFGHALESYVVKCFFFNQWIKFLSIAKEEKVLLGSGKVK